MRMSYVLAAPELMTAAATDLAAIGSAVDAAHLAAAAPTTGLIPAAADEVSTGIAALFGAHAQDYQAQARQVAAAQGQFATNLTGSAGAYAGAENGITSFLQALGEGYLALGNAVFTPLEQLIENGSPSGQVALVALIGLLIPYTLSVIVLNEIIKALTGQPI
jgi:PE family